MTPFDHEADMVSPPHARRMHRIPPPAIGSQSWRDQQQDDDDALGAARGLVNALMISLALWGVGGCIWLVLAVVMGWG